MNRIGFDRPDFPMEFGFDQMQSQSRPKKQLAASLIQGYEANPLEVREYVNDMNHAIVS
jgi:hypothetical protein